MTTGDNQRVAAAGPAVSKSLDLAVAQAITSMESRVAEAMRLATGYWPAVRVDDGDDPSAEAHELIKLLRAEADLAKPAQGARLLNEVSRLFEEVLKDPRSATKASLEALRKNPASRTSRRDAVRLLSETGNTELLARLVDDLANEIEALPERRALLLDHAATAELRRGNGERAASVYERVLEEDPGSLEAAEGLFRLLVRDHAWGRVAQLCRQMAEREDDGPTRVTLLIGAALLANELPVAERARWVAQGAAYSDNARLALPMATGLFRAAGDFESAINLQLEQTERRPEEAGWLHFLASWMLARQQDKVAEAIHHAEMAVEVDRDNPLHLSWLAELYERDARWDGLATVLRRKAELGTSREEQVETLVALAEILSSRLGDDDEAIEALERALSSSPTDLACLQTLGRLYATTGRWDDLAKMHLKEASVAEDDDSRASALYRCARILHRRLKRREEAIAHLEQAIALRPEFSPATRLLEDLYRKSGRYQDLVKLYRAELSHATNDTQRISLLDGIATLLDTQLDDTDGAVDAYEQLLELQPDNPPALRALARLYERQERYSQVLSMLRAQVMHASTGGEKVANLLRMGQILEQELSQPEQALAHYREALDVRPTAEAFEHVGRMLHGAQRWQDLLELYKNQLELTEAPDARVHLLFRIGRLHEQHIDDPEAAAASYKRALELRAGYWPAVRGITRVAHHLPDLRREGMETMLLDDSCNREIRTSAQVRIALSLFEQQPEATKEILKRAVEENADNTVARDLLLQLWVEDSRWREVLQLVDSFETIPVALGGLYNLNMALELCQKHGEDERGQLAAARWRDLLQSAVGQPEEVLDALRHRAEREPVPRRAALQLRAAQLLETDGDSGQEAIELCRKVLAESPREARALDLLEQLARRRGEAPVLAEVLEQRSQQARDSADRAVFLARRGALLAADGDEDAAIESWRRALDADISCRPAYESLKRAYAARQDKDGLRWVLERGADAIAHPETRIRDLLARVDLHLESDETRAVRDLDRILELDPGQPNALERLEQLLRARGETQRLAERLAAAADQVKLPVRQAALKVKLAVLHRDELNDLHRSADLLREAIDTDPDNVAALLVAADVQSRLDQPTEAVALLNRVVIRSEDQQELVGAHLATAELFHRVLGDLDRAQKSLHAVLELDEGQLAALHHMSEIAEELGNDEQVETALRRLVDLEQDPAARTRVFRRLAGALGRRHGIAAPETTAAIEQGLALAPGDSELLHLAADNYAATQRWDDLAQLLTANIDQLPEEQRTHFLLLLGRVLAQELGRRDEALSVMREAVNRDPSQEEAIELLVELLDEKDLEEPELRQEAIALHRRLLSKDPLMVTSIRRLVQLCSAEERIDEAYCAESTLVFLGEATEEELYFHKQHRRKAPVVGDGAVEAVQLASLVLPQGDHPVRTVLAQLKPHLPELVPPDLSHYGLTSLDTSALEESHPSASVVGDCARMLAAGEYRIVEALGGAPDGAIEPGKPSTLVLPREFSRLAVPHQRFICGRMLARIATDTECCDPRRPEPLSTRGIEILLVALLRTAEKGFGDDVASPAILEDMARRLSKAVDAETLETARDAARATWFEERHRASLAGWLRSCEVGAYRAGLLCSGNLESVSAFAERGGTPLPDEMVRGLIGFAVSQEFADLRAEVGMAITP